MGKYFQLSLFVLLISVSPSSQEHPQMQNLFRVIEADNLAAVLDIAAAEDYFKDKPITSLRNASGWTCLHVAAYFGANSVADHLIENGADLMAKNMLVETPLHLACQSDHADMARKLIEAAEQRQLNVTALVDAEQLERQTPIFYAAKTSIDVVSVLIEKKADMQHADIYGMLPVHYAVAHKRIDITNALLLNMATDAAVTRHGCNSFGKTISHLVAEHDFVQFVIDSEDHFNFSAIDSLGQTPSCWAATRGSVVIAKLLLQRGMNILVGNCVYDLKHGVNGSVLHAAAFNRQKQYVKLLLENGAEDLALDSTGGTAVHAMARQSASTANDVADIKEILKLFPRMALLARDNRSRTPFLLAVESSSLVFAKVLNDDEVIAADLEAVDVNGYSALHLVSSVEFFRYLQSTSRLFLDIEATTKSGNLTVLLSAVERKTPVTFLSHLINLKPNKGAVNDKGQNAVHLAVEANYLEAIEIFAAFAFNFSARDNEGRTPLMYALELERNEAALRILTNFPNKDDALSDCRLDTLDTPLNIAAMKPSAIEVVKLLVKNGKVNLSAVNANNETALHKAVANLNIEAVKLLMEKGSASSLSVKDNFHRSPLHLVATWCNSAALEIGRFLLAELAAGSSTILQLVDIYGNAPLDVAIRHNCLEMVDLFMAASSDKNCQVTNSRGLTSWQLAKSLGYESLAEILVKSGRCAKQTFVADCENVQRYIQCGEVPVIENGIVSHGASCLGSKRKISCKSGFRLTGSEIVECNSDYKWIVRGICEEIRCSDEHEIENGNLSSGLSSIGAERTLTCEAGFDLIGPTLVVCGSDEKWIARGHCLRPIDCSGRCLDCEAIHTADSTLSSGIYAIYPPDRPPIAVYCEMTYLGGGWTVFQRRVDGSQDFFLKWADYKAGFGTLSSNFWLGNDNIHAITSGQNEYNLLIALTANNGQTGYALHDGFHIEDEANRYTLRYKSFKVNGGIGDTLTHQKDMKFTTIDSDNDLDSSLNCANRYKGAWWYNACHGCNLNGVYGSTEYGRGLNWASWRGLYESMKTTAMMVRRSSL